MSPVKLRGWVIDRMNPDRPLDLIVRCKGVDYDVKSEWYPRPDLRNFSGNRAGFTATVVNHVEAINWINGNAQVIALSDDGRRGTLRVSEVALACCVRNLLSEYVAEQSSEEFLRWFVDIIKSMDIPRIKLGMVIGAIERVSAPQETFLMQQATQAYLPLGTKSIDGIALLGRSGHVFLIGGTNNVLSQYSASPPSESDRASSKDWLAVFTKRRMFVTAHGGKYLQLIIPEKLSVMPELYPEQIATPSRRLMEVESNIEGEVAEQSYFSVYSLFRDYHNRTGLFRKVDTHLSEEGGALLFTHILDYLGLPRIDQPEFEELDEFNAGDLSDRFSGLPLLNIGYRIKTLDSKIDQADLLPVEEHGSRTGGHLGRRLVWRNENATCDKRVVAFGNSFFERGANPSSLSWWFARYFKEFHFVWEPGLQKEYVEKTRPDIVVCQTIERFLRMVPAL